MKSGSRRVFLQDYIGLANRFESLTLSFAIQRAHGHEICLDWPELDALAVAGTHTRTPGFLGRLGALRLRNECTAELFSQLGKHPRILQRTYLGPDEQLESLYVETLTRISVRRSIAQEIQAIFAPYRGRPVVGVHIRRGDYPLVDSDLYHAGASRHPAVPLWWYEATMALLVKRFSNCAFYVSYSGSGDEFAALGRNFDLIEAHSLNPYSPHKGHDSVRHPVVDLFALACCTTVLATPLSSFSHYAANLLGARAACLLPPRCVSRGAGATARLDLPGRRLVHWTSACRSGAGQPLSPSQLGEIALAPPQTDWLPVTTGG